jgi:hypothetical protein
LLLVAGDEEIFLLLRDEPPAYIRFSLHPTSLSRPQSLCYINSSLSTKIHLSLAKALEVKFNYFGYHLVGGIDHAAYTPVILRTL